MRTRLRWGCARGLGLSVMLACAGGCVGPSWYATQASVASSKLEEARAVGAERLAPYEYYLADEHMKKASEEAAEASYGDAIDLAEAAETHAERAIRVALAAKKGAP